MFDKIKALLKNNELANDGSRELAQQYVDIVTSEEQMRTLLENPAFTQILEQMKTDFLERVSTLVDDDPELRAMKKMFIRTLGLKGAKEKIQEHLESFIEETDQGY